MRTSVENASASAPDIQTNSVLSSMSPALFTPDMQSQLRAQILVLGALRKKKWPYVDLVKSACVGAGPGLDAVLLKLVNVTSGVQDVDFHRSDLPTEETTGNASPVSENEEARNFTASRLTDLPFTSAPKEDSLAAAESPVPPEPFSGERRSIVSDGSEEQGFNDVPSRDLVIALDQTTTVRPDSNEAEHITGGGEIGAQEDDEHLEMAQASAQDALTTATSALAQSHMVWARLHSEDKSEEGAARDARIAKVAATVAAAASVAKAAVEAARAIAEVSMDAFIQASGHQAGDAGAILPESGMRSTLKSRQMASGVQSPFHGSTTKNGKASAHHRAEMVETVVQAAGKAAEAASQAGAVLDKAYPLIQTNGMDGFWARRMMEVDAVNGVDTMAGINDVDTAAELNEVNAANETDTGNEVNEVAEVGAMDGIDEAHECNVSRKGKTPRSSGTGGKFTKTKRHKSHLEASSATAVNRGPKHGRRKKDVAHENGNNAPNRSAAEKELAVMEQLGLDTAPENDVAELGKRQSNAAEITQDKSEAISKGSAVEVMTDEEGLRGGWFSGKVLKLRKWKALVVWDDLLTDSGTENIQEWFTLSPLKPVNGKLVSRRQVRPVHPFSIDKESGSKKRKRVASGCQTWNEGDHVDAFIQDAWWEGVVVELNDMDPSKVTIYFPGENDTQIVKMSDLRPSLQWKDKKWMPWMDPILVEDEPPQKRQKVEGSNKKAKKDTSEKLNVQQLRGQSSKENTKKRGFRKQSRINQEPSSSRNMRSSADKKKPSSDPSTKPPRHMDSGNKNASKNEIGSIKTRQAHEKDVASPVYPKKLDFAMDTASPKKPPTISKAAQARPPVTRGKLRAEDKKDCRKVNCSFPMSVPS